MCVCDAQDRGLRHGTGQLSGYARMAVLALGVPPLVLALLGDGCVPVCPSASAIRGGGGGFGTGNMSPRKIPGGYFAKWYSPGSNTCTADPPQF